MPCTGSDARWIGPEDAELPAPTLTLAEGAAEDEESHGGAGEPTAAPAAVGSGGNSDGGGSDGLAIAALAVGALGLIAGLVAFFAARRSVRARPA